MTDGQSSQKQRPPGEKGVGAGLRRLREGAGQAEEKDFDQILKGVGTAAPAAGNKGW